MELASFAAIGQLFLELSKEIRAILRGRERKRMSLAGVGSLLQLYGSSIRLQGLSLQLREALKHTSDRIDDTDRELLHEFVEEVKAFGEHLREIDLYTIDIYAPGLSRLLNEARGNDHEVLVALYSGQLTKSSISKRKVRGILKLLPIQYYPNGSWRDWRGVRVSGIHYADGYLKVSELRRDLLSLISLLEQCRRLIGKIVSESWSYREILERSKPDAQR